MQPATLALIKDRGLAKGDVLEVARLAGIMAAKRTGELIPLCHPLPITAATVDFSFENDDVLKIEATVRVFGIAPASKWRRSQPLASPGSPFTTCASPSIAA